MYAMAEMARGRVKAEYEEETQNEENNKRI